MTRSRLSLPPLAAALLTLAVPASAAAASLVRVDGDTLIFTGTPNEPNNITVSHVDGKLRVDENGSRMAAVDPCTLTRTGYRVECPDAGIARIKIATSSEMGSDVRMRTGIPASIHGGAGDDVIVGGPGDDVIDGGRGMDVIAGGGGADVLRGSRSTLVTYVDGIAADGTLVPRITGVVVRPGVADGSGGRGEHDTVAKAVGQLEGTSGDDVVYARDGVAQSITCGAGDDTVWADPRDDVATDCERVFVAPAHGEPRMSIPTLAFPFAGSADRAHANVAVGPRLPVVHDAVIVRVTCPVAIGLLAMDGPGCSGRVRIARGATTLATRRVTIARGATSTVKVALTASRALARRPSGLAVTATALPDRGHVARVLRFTVKG